MVKKHDERGGGIKGIPGAYDARILEPQCRKSRNRIPALVPGQRPGGVWGGRRKEFSQKGSREKRLGKQTTTERKIGDLRLLGKKKNAIAKITERKDERSERQTPREPLNTLQREKGERSGKKVWGKRSILTAG